MKRQHQEVRVTDESEGIIVGEESTGTKDLGKLKSREQTNQCSMKRKKKEEAAPGREAEDLR